MSQGSQEQASSAEEISSSMEQMVSNIQQNTDNAQQTEKIALKAAEDMQEGSKSVNMTIDSMKWLQVLKNFQVRLNTCAKQSRSLKLIKQVMRLNENRPQQKAAAIALVISR